MTAVIIALICADAFVSFVLTKRGKRLDVPSLFDDAVPAFHSESIHRYERAILCVGIFGVVFAFSAAEERLAAVVVKRIVARVRRRE
jgi:hypothetical protein